LRYFPIAQSLLAFFPLAACACLRCSLANQALCASTSTHNHVLQDPEAKCAVKDFFYAQCLLDENIANNIDAGWDGRYGLI
jgi:hypothetical protein